MASFDVVRAFAALNVDVDSLRRVTAAADRLRLAPTAPSARWVTPTRLHLTLKFFGEIDVGVVPALRDALGALAKETAVPRVAFAGFSAFPSEETARVIFAKAEDAGAELATLAAAVEGLAESLGFPRASRAFLPHMTLARTAAPFPVGQWLAAVPPWRVVGTAPELALYRSDVGHPGAEYEALGRFALARRSSTRKTA